MMAAAAIPSIGIPAAILLSRMLLKRKKKPALPPTPPVPPAKEDGAINDDPDGPKLLDELI